MEPKTYLKLGTLSQCVFQVGSFNKRFVRDLAALGEYDLLSPRQEANVHVLYWRYRRQISAIQERYPNAGYPNPIQPIVGAPVMKFKTETMPQGVTVRAQDRRTVEALAKLDEWNKKATP